MPRFIIIIVVGALMLAVAVGLGVFVIVPKQKRLSAVSERIALLDNAIAQREKFISDAKAQANNLDDELNKRLRLFLPKTKNLPQLLALLDSLGTREGVAISKIGFNEKGASPAAASTSFADIDISLEAAGSYESIRSLFGALERNIRLIDVKAFSLAPRDAGTLMGLNVELTTYYRK